MSTVIFTAGYLDGDDDLTSMKGHRSDVLFRDEEGHYYELNFITIERLGVELNSSLESGDHHYADTGLVILDSITKDSIVKTVRKLIEKRYFFTQKKVNLLPESKWSFFKL
jgi:hypothetical protein